MTDAPEVMAIRALYNEMQRIRNRVPSNRWFFFGSITTTKRPVGDFDLLLICETAADCKTVRTELASICAQFPIHLLLMTPSEEAQGNFIQREKAVGLNPCSSVFIRARSILRQREHDVGVAKFIRFTGKASRLSAFIAGDPPHSAVAILGEQQGSIMCHRHPDRPAPNTALVGDEASHKVFILSGWNSVV